MYHYRPLLKYSLLSNANPIKRENASDIFPPPVLSCDLLYNLA